MIEKLSRFWAGAIAYVALLTGAGLSVAGNVADTYRTRAGATDALDVILAGAWPVLVLLTIELFVSRRWSPERGFQVLRWLGCLAIGSMAMMVSWVHLHDLLSSRGQILPVATGGPLAIDGMAIMATGLLLSTRGMRRVATVDDVATFTPVEDMATVDEEWMDDVATEHHERPSRPGNDLFARLEREMSSETTPAAPLDIRPVSGPPRGSNKIKPESVPEDARAALLAWAAAPVEHRPSPGQRNELVTMAYGVSTRTARRWYDAVKAQA